MDPTWVDIASKFGVPVAILIAIWWGGAKILRWVAVELVIPIRDRGIKYLDDNLLWMRALGQRLDQMSADQATHHAREDEMQEHILQILNDKYRPFDWSKDKPKSDPKKTMTASPSITPQGQTP